jgi:uncharacterized membrane protein (UPF0127 family)
MMAILKNTTRNQIITPNLEVARGLIDRGMGLMGRKKLSPEEGLWLTRGNSIHTHFMYFAIDCIFVDENLQVQHLVEEKKPWGIIWPIWKACSVFELPAGTIRKFGIQKGDQLHVGD